MNGPVAFIAIPGAVGEVRSFLLVSLFRVVFSFPALGAIPPLERDEERCAEIPREIDQPPHDRSAGIFVQEIARGLETADLPRRTFRTSLLRGRAVPCAV